jgi:hypothetical protein
MGDALPRGSTSRDGDTLVAWVREAADELEKAHAILDVHGVPRGLPVEMGGDGKTECTLAARIALALHRGPDG